MHVIFVIFIALIVIMRFNRYLLLLMIFFAGSPLYAQHPADRGLQHCAADEVRQYLQSALPGIRTKEMGINQKIQSYQELHPAGLSNQESYFPGGTDFIIPVVVHIFHNGEPVCSGSNIS